MIFLIDKELEKELELQIGMKTEMEIAMKLLEKDTHEKQDTLVALRQQLEEVKAINLQMFHKVQVGADSVCLAQPCDLTPFLPQKRGRTPP